MPGIASLSTFRTTLLTVTKASLQIVSLALGMHSNMPNVKPGCISSVRKRLTRYFVIMRVLV